jgi:hypothetical protein
MYRDIQARALDGTGGRANAVKAKCLECCNWQKGEVSACQIRDCPLWHYRPYQPKTTAKTGEISESEGTHAG